MSIFDLVFIVVFLTSVVYLVRILYLVLRKRWNKALRLIKHLALFLGIYFSIVLVVSLITPQRILNMGENQCFDDWCIAVDRAVSSPTIGSDSSATPAEGIFYLVTTRVSSRAKRVSQRATDAMVYLVDGDGRKYYPSPAGQRIYDLINGEAKPLNLMLSPGESFTTVRVFDLPRDAKDVGLIVSHGIPGPGWFIIGDSQSILHKRTVIKLNADSSNYLKK